MNDREWLTTQYLPRLRGRILYIGVNDYTASYPTLVQEDNQFESLDSCPHRSQHMSRSAKHHNVYLKDYEDEEGFDHVSMHGCHGFEGYNINNKNILEDIQKADSLVKSGGTLQFGPTCSRVASLGEDYWYSLVKTDIVFQKYETLYCEAVGWGSDCSDKNFIWWGRKYEK